MQGIKNELIHICASLTATSQDDDCLTAELWRTVQNNNVVRGGGDWQRIYDLRHHNIEVRTLMGEPVYAIRSVVYRAAIFLCLFVMLTLLFSVVVARISGIRRQQGDCDGGMHRNLNRVVTSMLCQAWHLSSFK